MLGAFQPNFFSIGTTAFVAEGNKTDWYITWSICFKFYFLLQGYFMPKHSLDGSKPSEWLDPVDVN